jgi:hypothetical protein
MMFRNFNDTIKDSFINLRLKMIVNNILLKRILYLGLIEKRIKINRKEVNALNHFLLLFFFVCMYVRTYV